MPLSRDCNHTPTSPGQAHCTCLELIMWQRLLIELQARRIGDLEREAQRGAVRYVEA